MHKILKDKINKQLKHFIQDIPSSVALASAKNVTMNKFPQISSSQFYYYFKQVHYKNKSLDELINIFESKNYHVFIDRSE